MEQWYYVDKNQQRIGPMEANVLVDAMRHGQLNTASLVWKEGMPAWQPLSMHFDALGVPELLRARKQEKSGCAIWAIVLVVMGVLAIPVLGILIAIALPAYQDYTIRAKVSEGLNLAAAAKLAVSETVLETKQWPNNDVEAGYTPASTAIVEEVTIVSAQNIRITYSSATPEIAGKTLMLHAEVNGNGIVEWACNAANANKLGGESGSLPGRYAPASCR